VTTISSTLSGAAAGAAARADAEGDAAEAGELWGCEDAAGCCAKGRHTGEQSDEQSGYAWLEEFATDLAAKTATNEPQKCLHRSILRPKLNWIQSARRLDQVRPRCQPASEILISITIEAIQRSEYGWSHRDVKSLQSHKTAELVR
jgi:hypothetical protein